jgi:hypothetical protein
MGSEMGGLLYEEMRDDNEKHTSKGFKMFLAMACTIGLFVILICLLIVMGVLEFGKDDDEENVSWNDGALSEWEKRFLDGISACHLRCGLQSLTNEGHVAGSDLDEREASILETSWVNSGLSVTRNVFNVLLSFPTDVRSVELLPGGC